MNPVLSCLKLLQDGPTKTVWSRDSDFPAVGWLINQGQHNLDQIQTTVGSSLVLLPNPEPPNSPLSHPPKIRLDSKHKA